MKQGCTKFRKTEQKTSATQKQILLIVLRTDSEDKAWVYNSRPGNHASNPSDIFLDTQLVFLCEFEEELTWSSWTKWDIECCEIL